MNLKEIVSKARVRVGQSKSTTVLSSTNFSIVQMAEYLEETINQELVLYKSMLFRKSASFITTAVELQGTLLSLFGPETRIVQDTVYDSVSKQRVFEAGSTAQSEWIRVNQGGFASLLSYEVRGGSLYFVPKTTAGRPITCVVETKGWVVPAAGPAKTVLGSDDDTFLLPDEVLIHALVYKWKQKSGLPSVAEEAAFHRMFKSFVADSATDKELDIGGRSTVKFGVYVPEGSWPL